MQPQYIVDKASQIQQMEMEGKTEYGCVAAENAVSALQAVDSA